MGKIAYHDALTGQTEIIEVPDEEFEDTRTLEEVRASRLNDLSVSYASSLIGNFTSSVTGVPLLYSYSKDSQFIYSKWANVLALNPTKDLVYFDAANHDKIFMTRAQFLSLMDEIEQNEVNLYLDFKEKQYMIKMATTPEEIMSVIF